MGLALAVRVQGRDPSGETWEEMTMTEDASFGGTRFRLNHAVALGQCVHLSLPLPKRFRRHDLTEPSYHVYALVRCLGDTHPSSVGAMFLGKHPPKGYESNPGGRYLLSTDPPPAAKERRLFRRLDVFMNLKLKRSSGTGEELTVAENLGKGGARVLTSLTLTKGEIIEVEELGGTFKTRAEIRNIYLGKDRVCRLNLRFLDREPPDRLVSAG